MGMNKRAKIRPVPGFGNDSGRITGRRRFMGALAGMAATATTLNLLTQERRGVELSLKEADFYKPHNLAG